nr:hypothetical protein [Tanacetum cinerariifolium]
MLGIKIGIATLNLNQNGNGNGVAVRAEGNGIQLQAKEFDLMAAAGDLNEIKEVNANCILMANLQKVSTSDTQIDNNPVYDSDRSAENDSNVNSMVFNVEQSRGAVEQNPATVEETPKLVRGFEYLANDVDESLAKHKALEHEIEHFLRAVVSQYIMSIVQNPTIIETFDLQTELEQSTAKIRRPQPRRNTKNNRAFFVSKNSFIKNKEVKVEEHHRNLLLFNNKKHMSPECNNIKLAILNDKSKVICAMTSFGFHPFQYFYPERKITIEEMLYKFINEGRREHKEMGAFIIEFKTTNELLLKERNNALRKLEFEVYGLSRTINNAQLSDCKVKGITTRGGKTTTETICNTNINNKEPLMLYYDKHEGPNEVLIETNPQEMKEQTIELPIPSIPFPHRLTKEKEEAQQRRLEEASIVTMNERCLAVLLNKLPSKAKEPGSLEEPKPIRMSLELANRSIKYPRGIVENVLIKIDKFVLPIELIILDMWEDSRIPIIMERLFIATVRAMIDVFNRKITLRIGKEEVIFDVDQSIKRPPAEDDECYGIDDLDTTINLETQELLEDDQRDLFMLNVTSAHFKVNAYSEP